MADRPPPDVFNRLSAARAAARHLTLPPELVELRDAYLAASYECQEILDTAADRNVDLGRDERLAQRYRDHFHHDADTIDAMYGPLERLVTGERGGDTTRTLRALRSAARIGRTRRRRLEPTTA